MKNLKLQQRALHMALKQYVSSEHTEEEAQTIVDALHSNNEFEVDRLGILIWEPFENYVNSEVADIISTQADVFLDDLEWAANLDLKGV